MKQLTTIFFLVLAFGAFGQFTLTDSLQAYYPFNTNALDMSGNGNDGAINGAILTTDRFGSANSAFEFDGNTSHINLSRPFDYLERTVNIWFFSYNITAGAEIIYDSDNNFLLYGKTAFAAVEFAGIDSIIAHAGGFSNLNKTAISENVWYMITITVNGATAKYYIDGFLIDSNVVTNTTSGSGAANAILGASRLLDRSLDGKIDDVRIYNRVLSISEIVALYNEVPLSIDPVVDYPFNYPLGAKVFYYDLMGRTILRPSLLLSRQLYITAVHSSAGRLLGRKLQLSR